MRQFLEGYNVRRKLKETPLICLCVVSSSMQMRSLGKVKSGSSLIELAVCKLE